MSLISPMTFLLEQFDGDEAFVRQMLALFISQSSDIGIRLQAAIQNQDAQEALALAHELKGMALNVGLESVANGAAALEDAIKTKTALETPLQALQASILDAVQSLNEVL